MPHVDYGGPTGGRLIGCFLQQGGGGKSARGTSAVWRMEQGGLWPPVFGRAQEPRFLRNGPY
jgi:hypothetical protein